MLRKFSTKRIAFFFIVIDWFGSLAMVVVAAFVRSSLGMLPKPIADLLGRLHITAGEISTEMAVMHIFPGPLLILIAFIWPFFLVVFSVYDGSRNETVKHELLNVFMAICVSMMTLSGILFYTYQDTSRVMLVLFFIFDLSLLLGSRMVLWGYRQSKGRKPLVARRAALVVGAGPVGQNVVAQLMKYAWADIQVIGFVDDDPQKQGKIFEGVPVLGTLDQIKEIVSIHHIQEAVIALPLRAYERIGDVCEKLQALLVGVHVIPDLFSLNFPHTTLEGFGGIPVINIGQTGIHGWRRVVKRVFDTIMTVIGMVVLAPVFLVIAILIKLDSKGPVFYRQQRVGECGRPFTMFKFRSMRVDADPNIHKAYVSALIRQNISLNDQSSLKMTDDPRVTKIGRFLRKTSLDELPQLINVLRGEMSIVGPRPPIGYEVELYQNWHKRRLEAIPGITGLWQVKARNQVSFDEMVRLDLEYIERQSLWLDILIILQTPFAVLGGRGAG